MKKFLVMIALLSMVVLSGAGNYRRSQAFLATAVDVDASASAVNGTEFTSREIRVSQLGDPESVAITVTFTRAAGAADLISFEFEGSYDGGTTWTTVYFSQIQVATNATAVSNVVRKTVIVAVNGISHLRLSKIANGDAANNTTACNASMSI